MSTSGIQGRKAYELGFVPVRAKELIVECDVRQSDISAHLGVSRALVNRVINGGYMPPKRPQIRQEIEEYLIKHSPRAGRVTKWLRKHELRSADIWEPLGRDMRRAVPAGAAARAAATQRNKAMIPGDPNEIDCKEIEMITLAARKHFKLVGNPFPPNGGVDKDSDIYRSEDHRFIELMMLDTANNGGCTAICGEVGCGKSTIRKSVVEQLQHEGKVNVVFPMILDKKRITDASLCSAIIMDISSETPKVTHEAMSRQVKRLLTERNREGNRCCLIIEEAQCLTVQAFKIIKQLYELEFGFRKLLSIILIGQTELGEILDTRTHPEMREMILRTQIARIEALGDNLRPYLALKFARVGVRDLSTIFETGTNPGDPDAIEALGKRLTEKDETSGRTYSIAYPLAVNNWVVRAMNQAAELGEPKVTEEVIYGI